MRILVLLAALALLPPAAAHGQAPGSHTGPWFAVGAGGGWVRVSCSICANDRPIGAVGTVRFGTAIRPGLLLGAEADVWTREDEGENRHVVGAFIGAAYLYPKPGGGLYLKGGGGLLAYRADEDLASNLFGLVVGAGYELAVTERFVLANDVSLVASSFGALRNGDLTAADDVSVTLLQLGLAIRSR